MALSRALRLALVRRAVALSVSAPVTPFGDSGLCGHYVYVDVPIPAIVTEETVIAEPRFYTASDCPICSDKEETNE